MGKLLKYKELKNEIKKFCLLQAHLLFGLAVSRVLCASLVICLISSTAGIFAAALPEAPPVSKEQAAHMLAREFRFTKDQQKMLRAQLDEMSKSGKFRGYVGTFRGYVDMSAAREVALGIKEMPTQAGPAVTKEEGVEEKEEKEAQDGEGEKWGKAIKNTPARQDVERVVSEFLPPELVSSLVGDYADVLPWNIKFEQGKLATLFECGSFLNFQASADGHYVAVQKQRTGARISGKTIDIWDMQEMRIARQLVMEESAGRWVFSPCFDMAASASGEKILIAKGDSGKIVHRMPTDIIINDDSLRFFDGEGGLQLIATGLGNTVFTWDAVSGNLIEKKMLQFAIPGIRLNHFFPDGKLFYGIIDTGESLFVGKVDTGELMQEIKLTTPGAKFAVLMMGTFYAFDLQGKRVAHLVLSGNGYHIYIWDLQNNKQLCSIDIGNQVALAPMVFSPDGRYLLVGMGGAKARFFDLQACEREYREKIARGDTAGMVTNILVPSRLTIDEINTQLEADVRAFTPEQSRIWEIELNKLANQSLDRKVELGDARNLLDEIASMQSF